MNKALLCFLLLVFSAASFAQKKDKKLQGLVEKLVQDFRGDIGIYIKNLNNNKIVAINADTIFPTASIVKVPILVGIMDKIEKGELQYHNEIVFKDSLFYGDGDVLSGFKNNSKIELSKVIMLMLTTSDNTASLWLQGLAGSGSRINELMDSLNLPNTKVNSRTPKREAYRAQYGWGQTTPFEMTTLFEKIVNKQVISTTASTQMVRVLGRNYWDEQAIISIPENVFVASKNGAVNASRSEVLYVNGKKNSYIFSIFTKNIKDTSWENNNEAWQLAVKLSALLWDYYN